MKLVLNLTAATLAVAALALSGTAANAQIAFAINGTGAGTDLISFDLATPNVVTSLPLSVQLDALDFRAQTGVLYGYSNGTNTVYTVNTTTGALTSISPAVTAGQETTTTSLGMDFNPTLPVGVGTSSAFRIVTANDENRVYNVGSNTYTFASNNLRFVGGTNGDGAIALENAYSNNVANNTAGATGTVQYVIEDSTDSLYILNNNLGELTLVGALGVAPTAGQVGFDIFSSSFGTNQGFAVLNNAANAGASSLYSISLSSGAATTPLAIGNGTLTGVRSLAITPVVVPEAGTLPLVLGAFAAFGAGIVVRRRK